MIRVLLIEDDEGLAAQLVRTLALDGFDVVIARDEASLMATLQAESLDAVVIDLDVLGAPGFDALREIRRRGFEMPITVLASVTDVSDKIACFRLGADDFLVKPVSPLELAARIQAHLRAGHRRSADVIRDGRVFLDPNRRVAAVDDTLLSLSPLEFDLFHALVRAGGEVRSDQEILKRSVARRSVHFYANRRLPHHTASQETEAIRARQGAHNRGQAWLRVAAGESSLTKVEAILFDYSLRESFHFPTKILTALQYARS